MQRTAEFTPVPFGVTEASASSSASTEMLMSPKYSQHRETSCARACSGDRRIGACTSSGGSGRPDHAAVARSSWCARWPGPNVRAPGLWLRPDAARLALWRPVSTQNRPYPVPQHIEGIAVPGNRRWSVERVEHLPTAGSTGRAGSSSHSATAHRIRQVVTRCRCSSFSPAASWRGDRSAVQQGPGFGRPLTFAVRGGQPDLQEQCATGVAREHLVDLGVGQGDLPGQVRPLPGPNPAVGVEAVADAFQRFSVTPSYAVRTR